MNSTLKFYKKMGKATEKFAKLTSFDPIFKGVSVPIKQTPGRAQYYYADTIHLIPESIYYKVRMPKTFAGSIDSKKYEDVVEKEVLNFLKLNLSHNLFDPEKGLHGDLTVEQIKQMMHASEESFEKAESGELQKILQEEKTLRSDLESLRDKIDKKFEDLEDKIKIAIKQAYKEYKSLDITRTNSIVDYVPAFGRDTLEILSQDLDTAIKEGRSVEESQKLLCKVYNIANAKNAIAQIELDLLDCWNEHHFVETYDRVSHNEASQRAEEAKKVLSHFSQNAKNGTDSCPFKEILSEVSDNLVPAYKETCAKHEVARSHKENFYLSFIHSESYDHNPDKLKENLLAHLSSTIIVKEHRFRYQQEQYERYIAFMQFLPMLDHMTIREFSKRYADALRREIALSYHEVSPKIDANYDNYGERTVKPINSAVFYYFFSAHKARRKFAQVILSAARYPNEKIRRAYLRFFSNA